MGPVISSPARGLRFQIAPKRFLLFPELPPSGPSVELRELWERFSGFLE